jgi:hypothetical protein
MTIISEEFDPDTWRAFRSLWVEERSTSEVSQELGKSIPWLYKAKFLVLKRLKEVVLSLSADTEYYT